MNDVPFRSEYERGSADAHDAHAHERSRPLSFYAAWIMLVVYGLALLVGAAVFQQQVDAQRERDRQQAVERAHDIVVQSHKRCVAFRRSVSVNRTTLKAVIEQSFAPPPPTDAAALADRYIAAGVDPAIADDIAIIVASSNVNNPTRAQQLQTLLALVDGDPLPDCSKVS